MQIDQDTLHTAINQVRGRNASVHQIYLSCADNGQAKESMPGQPSRAGQ